MAFVRKLLRCACVVCALYAGVVAAEPENGWWWNPNESGRGYFIEMRGGTLYISGYFYEGDGRATWMTSGGPVTDLYLYKGTLQRIGTARHCSATTRPRAPRSTWVRSR